MGIYDRDYQRDYYSDRPRNLGADWSMTTWLIVINVGVYVLQMLTRPEISSEGLRETSTVADWLSLSDSWLSRPWEFYTLLTYGFTHSDWNLMHLGFNMLGLFMFGRAVEERYGSREYLAFYLTSIIVAGLLWQFSELANPRPAVLLGASGGVVAVVMLFVFNFPHRTVLLMFAIPIPAWVLGVVIVAQDAFGAIGRSGNVAFTAHLGGALFAYLYYRNKWSLARYLPYQWRMPKFRMGPRLKVHRPDEDDATAGIDREVDRILKKINDQGQDSLTAKERKTLEQASRQYQHRKRG